MGETKRNPKLEGSNLWDCRPQTGPCPMNCNQCFYNRPGAFYEDINKPTIPSPEEIGRDGIIRMNCGHDSNLQRELIIETAKKYNHVFFNTSIPRFDFPNPVVFTANPKEEKFVYELPVRFDQQYKYIDNLMFVRLRTSASNLEKIEQYINYYCRNNLIPVVLTFMSYYEENILNEVIKRIDWETLHEFNIADREKYYIWKIRHINPYWCPTKEFMQYVLQRMKKVGGRLVTICGTFNSNYCRDCRNCETYYWQTLRHLRER